MATFMQWVDSYARGEAELVSFYRERFRAEFKPAFDAWIATKPLKTEGRPADAVRDAASTGWLPGRRPIGSTRRAEALSAQVRRDIQRASNYVLGVVLFAVALFFAGMSTKLTARGSAQGDARGRLRHLRGHRHLDRDVPVSVAV